MQNFTARSLNYESLETSIVLETAIADLIAKEYKKWIYQKYTLRTEEVLKCIDDIDTGFLWWSCEN